MKSFIKYTALGAVSIGLVGLALSGPALAAKGGHGMRGERGAMSFEKMDANSDGFITIEDFAVLKQQKFNEQDANKDGFITLDEMQAAAAKRFEGREHKGDEEHMQDRAEHMQDRTEHMQDRTERMQDRTERMLRYLDENGDGKVAIDELPERNHDRMIARFDADDDGKVSPAEFEEAKAKFRKGGHGGKGRHEHAE